MKTITKSYSLKNLVTLKTDQVASEVFFIKNKKDIEYLKKQYASGVPIVVLGGGSNTFFAQDYNGLVAVNQLTGIEVVEDKPDFVVVKVASGENWDSFVEWSLNRGYYGLENLSLIPGTVGASPIQNIGAYGVEVGNFITKVDYFDMTDSFEPKSINQEDCRFGYRDSIFKQSFKDKVVISSVYYQLSKTFLPNTSYDTLIAELAKQGETEVSAQKLRQAVIRVRQSRLPDWKSIPNAGSFFKNALIDINHFKKLKLEHPNLPYYETESEKVVKVPTAWLLEQAGWKGVRVGHVGTYEKQPLIVTTDGYATGAEIISFANAIIKDIKNKYGINLELEVNYY